ncbi:Alpha,alpha-trehalase [Legionella busanensis]|uniref:Alpha,alpha-trehalase n=1 Tax=Legionella busanensis TaxID=190655 RepID=A0A378JJ50_9GAMM|nr:trehalase family glycosidase [Legionella busanensis]STX51087.1 Alpha,alpha-trehalase [Legionella busanensis]
MRKLLISFFIINCFYSFSLNAESVTTNQTPEADNEIHHYISRSWDVLTRDNRNLFKSWFDSKLPEEKLIIYVPKGEDIEAVKLNATQHLPSDTVKWIEFRYLPKNINSIKEHGLLYLPFPYVVPGGRFNEMYGWDSYFIELGLLEHNRLQLAKNMVDNLIYEVKHYGTILNANRTYYLERSHPPLLTEMILAYYYKTQDKEWLKSTLPAINKLYRYWTQPPHLIPKLGLSRYYAGGSGPCPEESPTYYSKVIDYFQTHDVTDYEKTLYYNEHTKKLTPLFYRADRTVRESGFDITAKFGPFSAAIMDYAPVDLNVLLYKLEQESQEIYTILKQEKIANVWKNRAQRRAKLINRYLWDARTGYYFDYNFKTKKLRNYSYATTFYPLWAGIASKKQAQALINNLPNFLEKGGLLTSKHYPGLQWDAPFGWAPLHYFTVFGLENYGYRQLAHDVANRFIKTVEKGYEQAHTIFEKYDVEERSIHTVDKIKFSYKTNETGFGWTNGVYLVFINFIKKAPIKANILPAATPQS